MVARYTPALRRRVADQLVRSRSQRSGEELIEKLASTTASVPVIDRRLRELDVAARSLLALVHLSRLPRWRLGGLLELLSALQTDDGMAVVFRLFEAGLLYPELPDSGPQLSSFEDWLTRAASSGYRVFAPLKITERAASPPPELTPLVETTAAATDIREADGLEYPIRLGVLWQQVRAGPLRLTQQGSFFKKDQERLLDDPLLAGPAADEIVSVSEPGHLLVALGLALGLLSAEPGELVAADTPATLEGDWPRLLVELMAQHAALDSWDAGAGWRGLNATPSPYGSAAVLALALLRQLSTDCWAAPPVVASWLAQHHCYWRLPEETEGDETPSVSQELARWSERFLLGFAYQLRLVRAGRDQGGRWVVQLTDLGRSILGGGPLPELPQMPKTLLVQPNLEMVAYRQGLTPRLIGSLSRFAAWKTVGPACLLQLQPESVYCGLETSLTHEQILQTLQQHTVRELPPAVLQSLQTWSNKRDQVTVHAAATLLEFGDAAELEEALGRGLAATRLSERLALVAQESDIDYRQFRLAGARDYGLPPDQCAEVADDGVTLSIDLARADLLLETEVQRFAELVPMADVNGRRVYRLTPASLQRGREAGVGIRTLEEWFQQRTGTPLTPAARLLLDPSGIPPLVVRKLVVVQAPTEAVADGLMQWPASRALIRVRLGPAALVLEEDSLPALKSLLHELNVTMDVEAG
jgi:hypothetical protein